MTEPPVAIRCKQGFGRWPPAQSRQINSERPWERPLVHPSFLTRFPNTSSLPMGSLILPPRGQISLSVSLSCPNSMSLFEASPVTELLLNPLCVIAQKSPSLPREAHGISSCSRQQMREFPLLWVSSDVEPTVFPGRLLKH